MRLKVPRPAHQLADPIEQENWKKKLEQTHKQISQKYPDSEVEIWASGRADARGLANASLSSRAKTYFKKNLGS